MVGYKLILVRTTLLMAITTDLVTPRGIEQNYFSELEQELVRWCKTFENIAIA